MGDLLVGPHHPFSFSSLEYSEAHQVVAPTDPMMMQLPCLSLDMPPRRRNVPLSRVPLVMGQH